MNVSSLIKLKKSFKNRVLFDSLFLMHMIFHFMNTKESFRKALRNTRVNIYVKLRRGELEIATTSEFSGCGIFQHDKINPNDGVT